MKIKKFLAGILPLWLFAFLVFSPAQVLAAEGNGATMIVTTVPDSHTVKLVVEGQGTVTVSGQEYSKSQEIKVGRLKEQAYAIKAADGWKIGSVTYGTSGNAKDVQLSNATYTAPALYEDGNVLTATFLKDSSGTDTKPGSGGQSGGTSGGSGQGPKTGDDTSAGGYLLLMLAAGGMAAILAAKKQKWADGR